MTTLRRALIGLLATAPLVSVLYAGWKAAGLPFIPFDTFNWLTRVLPGRLVTAGVEILVAAVRQLHHGDISSAAKPVELALAVAIFCASLMTGSVLILAAMSGARRRDYRLGWSSEPFWVGLAF
jgi:hypothetical protein